MTYGTDFFETWAATNGCEPEAARNGGGGGGGGALGERTAAMLLASPELGANTSCVSRRGCRAETTLCIHNHKRHVVLAPEPRAGGSPTAAIAQFALRQVRAV